MAYFPNGTTGDVLDNQCCECLHNSDELVLCPVYLVQGMFNYQQDENPELEQCLNYLINEDGICQMKKTLEKLNLLNPELNDDRSELAKWEAERLAGRGEG